MPHLELKELFDPAGGKVVMENGDVVMTDALLRVDDAEFSIVNEQPKEEDQPPIDTATIDLAGSGGMVGTGSGAASGPGDFAPDPKPAKSLSRKGKSQSKKPARRRLSQTRSKKKKSSRLVFRVKAASFSLEDPQDYFGSEPPGDGIGWIKVEEGKWHKMAKKTQGPRIAIVGGGPAGLFTSYILNKKFPDAAVTMFEASERLGGKIRTDIFSDGTPFEAGVAELYEYLGPGGTDPLRMLIEKDLGLPTTNMKGGGVIVHGKLTRDMKDMATTFAPRTLVQLEHFHKRMAELMPLEKFARRWQPDNEHPWSDKTFREAMHEEVDDPIARHYIETAVHSDLATEPWTSNGLNGIKNVLLDNDEYMQLYHVRGGIEKVVDALVEKLQAEFRMECPVTKIERSGESYTVTYRDDSEPDTEKFDAVIVAMPNHWLSQIRWEGESLQKAIHDVIRHYDLPAHYFRVSLLFDKPFWEPWKIPGDFWMMDAFNGCCVYNESHRWAASGGHVLSFLLAGQDALLQCSSNQGCREIIDNLIDSLPDEMRRTARDHLQDAQVDQYAGSINAQPGGWPVEDLWQEHHPDPDKSPGVFLVGDYFFDSTLNACLISAGVAVEHVLEYFDKEAAPVEGAIKHLAATKVDL